MRNSVNTLPAPPLKIGSDVLEEVEEFKYLGSVIKYDGSLEREITTRITCAGSAFNKLRNVWRNPAYSLQLKLRLFNSNVLSVLMYGCESWALTKQLEKRIQGFENICLRRILGIQWTDKLTNASIREKTKQPLVIDRIVTNRWRYWGHMVRMGEGRLPHDVWCWVPSGIRRRGRQKTTLGKCLEKDAALLRSSLEELWSKAQERSSWRGTVVALCASRRGKT